MNNQKFKNSGVDWIGIIPNDWSVKRIKDVCVNLGGGNYGEDEGNPGYLIPCISISDFKNGDLSNTSTIKMNRVYKKKNILKNGSILIEKSGGGEKIPVGRSIYLNSDLEAYYTNFVQGLKVIENFPKFVNYCFQVIHKNKLHMDSVKQTTGLQNFEFNKFANYFQIPTPNLKIQAAISDYLDTETSKIDRKISILEEKFEKLEEYKQSVIFETVTKGLDRKVEMKDSGVDWIGDIPKHWEVKRVKEFVKLSQGLSVNSSEYVDESDVVLIRMGNIKKGGKIDLNHKNVYLPSKFKKSSKQYLLKENDIIIAMTDMSPNLDFLGVPAKLIGLNEDLTYIVNQRVGKLNFKTKDLNIDYFKYYLMTPLAKNQFKAEGLGTIQGNMSDSHFSNLFFVQPSWNEQNNMVTYLNTICSKIDKKVEIIKKQIELLKEYKQTIIYEAVTGKIEIN